MTIILKDFLCFLLTLLLYMKILYFCVVFIFVSLQFEKNSQILAIL